MSKKKKTKAKVAKKSTTARTTRKQFPVGYMYNRNTLVGQVVKDYNLERLNLPLDMKLVDYFKQKGLHSFAKMLGG